MDHVRSGGGSTSQHQELRPVVREGGREGEGVREGGGGGGRGKEGGREEEREGEGKRE